MNKLELSIRKVVEGESLEIDGVEFTKAVLVRLSIDGLPFKNSCLFDDALVVFPELLKSLSGNGLYLIFTSASGIADSGGWEGVFVKHENRIIYWGFEIDGDSYQFQFRSDEYENSIWRLEKEISFVSKELELEPVDIFFPESWG